MKRSEMICRTCVHSLPHELGEKFRECKGTPQTMIKSAADWCGVGEWWSEDEALKEQGDTLWRTDGEP